MRRITSPLRRGMQEKKNEGEQDSASDRAGLLIRGSFDEAMEELRRLKDAERPSMIISVGDVVSDNMIKHALLPQVLVVDNQVMRESIAPVPMDVDQTLYLKNPPQMLADEAWSVMREAIVSGKRTRILVDGEEDLITIVAVLCAPVGSFVVYGQPREGIVVVRVTEQRKEDFAWVVDNMERVEPKKAV